MKFDLSQSQRSVSRGPKLIHHIVDRSVRSISWTFPYLHEEIEHRRCTLVVAVKSYGFVFPRCTHHVSFCGTENTHRDPLNPSRFPLPDKCRLNGHHLSGGHGGDNNSGRRFNDPVKSSGLQLRDFGNQPANRHMESGVGIQVCEVVSQTSGLARSRWNVFSASRSRRISRVSH